MFTLLFTFLIIIFCPLIGKLIKSIVDYYKLNKEYLNGNTLFGLLTRLTPKEFLLWTSQYLNSLDYKNMTSYSNNSFLCEKDDNVFYIQCDNTSSSDITKEDITNFVGKLINLSIFNGVIVTSSEINDEAIEYINSYLPIYKIEVISLKSLPMYYDDFVLKNKGI